LVSLSLKFYVNLITKRRWPRWIGPRCSIRWNPEAPACVGPW